MSYKFFSTIATTNCSIQKNLPIFSSNENVSIMNKIIDIQDYLKTTNGTIWTKCSQIIVEISTSKTNLAIEILKTIINKLKIANNKGGTYAHHSNSTVAYLRN